MTSGAGRGVGLRNTRERLAVLYDDRHRFATIDNKPGLRIELGLPLEAGAAHESAVHNASCARCWSTMRRLRDAAWSCACAWRMTSRSSASAATAARR